jgi:hypothetical protein
LGCGKFGARECERECVGGDGTVSMPVVKSNLLTHRLSTNHALLPSPPHSHHLQRDPFMRPFLTNRPSLICPLGHIPIQTTTRAERVQAPPTASDIFGSIHTTPHQTPHHPHQAVRTSMEEVCAVGEATKGQKPLNGEGKKRREGWPSTFTSRAAGWMRTNVVCGLCGTGCKWEERHT